MRQDPLRFVTFVLGTYMLAYYGGIALQVVRVWRKIGRSPILWGTTPGERARVFAVFLWPAPILLWAHDPSRFSRLPSWAFLENWPLRLLGLMLLCAAAAVATTAYAELGDRWRIGVDQEQKSGFTRSGIYGSIRHPVYAALWLALFGCFVMAPNLLFAVLWAAGASAVIAQAEHEERQMTLAFGKQYRDYALQTGKFFPLWY